VFLQIDPDNPLRKDLKRAAFMLREGAVIAYPTDTIYGIGCDLFQKDSIERIYRIKRMPKYKQLSFICRDIAQVSEYAQVSNMAFKIIKRLAPGPFTFILSSNKNVPKIMMNKRREVGVRITSNPVCSALLEELDNPLINTSATVDKDEYMSDPYDIYEKFGNDLDLVIDGGVMFSDPSTVIDLTGSEPVVLRQGKGDASSVL